MSRRGRTDDSSLELLLDTITNTFGGVLFLAILLSLLLRTSAPTDGTTSRKTSSAMSAAEQASWEVTLEDLQDRVARLQRKQESQVARSHNATDDFVRRAVELTANLTALLNEQASTALETAEHQRAAASATSETAALEARIEAVTDRREEVTRAHEAAIAEAAELAQIRIRLDETDDRTTVTQIAGPPTLHDTDKKQVGLYVRFGRVFMMHAWRNGVRDGPNPEQFVVTPGNPPVARPKPEAGVLVTRDTVDQDIRQILRRFPPAQWVVAVVVFPDSFDVFQIIKRALVEAGYEYHPMPVKSNGGVFDSGGESRAQ